MWLWPRSYVFRLKARVSAIVTQCEGDSNSTRASLEVNVYRAWTLASQLVRSFNQTPGWGDHPLPHGPTVLLDFYPTSVLSCINPLVILSIYLSNIARVCVCVCDLQNTVFKRVINNIFNLILYIITNYYKNKFNFERTNSLVIIPYSGLERYPRSASAFLYKHEVLCSVSRTHIKQNNETYKYRFKHSLVILILGI